MICLGINYYYYTGFSLEIGGPTHKTDGPGFEIDTQYCKKI